MTVRILTHDGEVARREVAIPRVSSCTDLSKARK